MKILGRSFNRLFAACWNFSEHATAVLRCLALFRNPLTFLYCYIIRKNPNAHMVQLRSGVKLHLSQDDSDIVTVYLIFCRHDYGVIKPGTSIIDIGANIGIFSLYAALSGASSVHSYEPCEESFYILQKNITCNGFENIVTPQKAVVVGRSCSPIMFPRASSVHNSINSDEQQNFDNCSLVPAIALSMAIESLQAPNLVKMDCEGGEYDIILNSEATVFNLIDELRLEYHRGPKEQLFSAFEKSGYNITFFENGEFAGTIWCSKRPQT